jgi:short-subunit dehydrogenase
MLTPQAILITGASSGIGAALALAYAGPGITLALGGRSEARLLAIAEACRSQGATATHRAADVADRAAMADWIAEAAAANARGRLDLVIANAGISGGTGGRGSESAEQARRIFAVNVDGIVNTVLPAIEIMLRQEPDDRGRRGQIAIVSSLVGFRGLPGTPAYAASKAAIRIWGEGLRGSLTRESIALSVVCPGFIRTPLTDGNPYPMPFLMEPERAAAIIKRGLMRNRARVAFPWPMYMAAWLAGALPPSWTDPLLVRLPRKPARQD